MIEMRWVNSPVMLPDGNIAIQKILQYRQQINGEWTIWTNVTETNEWIDQIKD